MKKKTKKHEPPSHVDKKEAPDIGPLKDVPQGEHEKKTPVERKGPGNKHHVAEGTNMNKFASWKEYLDERGKVQEKPDINKIADYTGPDPKSPEAAKAPKALEKANEPPKAAGKPAPYKAANDAPKPKKAEKGLGEEGDKGLVYEPDTTHTTPNKVGQEGFSVPKKKTKTEQFLDKTSSMSISEFTQYMIEDLAPEEDEEMPSVTAYTTGKIQPHPPEVVKYLVTLAVKNDRIMDSIIHELKRQGGLKKLLEVLFEHPESYDGITDALGDEKDGPRRANSLVRSMDNNYSKFMSSQEDMYEAVAPPFGQNSDEDEEKKPGKGEEEDEDEVPTDGQSPDDEESPESEGSPEDMPPSEEDGEETNPSDQEGPPPDVSPEEGGETTPDMEEPGAEAPRKLKKKFAHDHILSAMNGIDHMREKMFGYMKK